MSALLLLLLGANAAASESEESLVLEAERIVVEEGEVEAEGGSLEVMGRQVHFERGTLDEEGAQFEGVTIESEGWGWWFEAERLDLSSEGAVALGVALSRCRCNWRPWLISAERAEVTGERVTLEGSSLRIFELLDLPIWVPALSTEQSPWGFSMPTLAWLKGDPFLSIPFSYSFDSGSVLEVDPGWWRGPRLGGRVNLANGGKLSAAVAMPDGEWSGTLFGDWKAGSADLGAAREGGSWFGVEGLTWIDSYELRNREFLDNRLRLQWGGLSLERLAWQSRDASEAIHGIAWRNSFGARVGVPATQSLGVALVGEELRGEASLVAERRLTVGLFEVEAQGGATAITYDFDGAVGDLEGRVGVWLPMWARFGAATHELSLGFVLGGGERLGGELVERGIFDVAPERMVWGPSLRSDLWGVGAHTLEVWAPLGEEGELLVDGSAASLRSTLSGVSVELLGEVHEGSVAGFGALDVESGPVLLSLLSWSGEAAPFSIASVGVPLDVIRGRLLPEVGVLSEGTNPLETTFSLEWKSHCGCLFMSGAVSVADDRETSTWSGQLTLTE